MIGTNRNISGFDPRTVAKCCLWLDGADPRTLFSDVAGTTNSTLNGLVALWKDKSGANANVSNATSGQQPTYISTGLSYDSATNSGKWLFGVPPALNSGGISAFVVFNPKSLTSGASSGRKAIFRLATLDGYVASFDNIQLDIGSPNCFATQYVLRPTVSTVNLMSMVSYSKNTVDNLGIITTAIGWSLNSELSSTKWSDKSFGTSSGNDFAIGSRSNTGSLTFDGTISEIIVYDAFLTEDQIQTIRRYLSHKWNVTSQRISPLTIPNCVLWNDAASLTGTGTVGNWPNPAGATTVACGGTKTPNGKNGLTTVMLTTSQTWVPNPVVALGAHTLFWSGRQTAGYGGANGRVLQGTSNNHLYGYWGGYKRSFYNNANPGLHVSGIGSDGDWDTFSYSRIAEGRYNISWNGTLMYEGSTSTGSWMDGLVINTGASPLETSNCEIGEIILYNRILGEEERMMIELYLYIKWYKSLRLPNNFPLDTVTPRLRVFQPTDFRDCYCWVDAVQDTTALGTTISTLPDWSRNAPSIAPIGGSITLQANGLNGRPVYNFGTSRAMSEPTFTWNSSFTQFAVVQCATGNWIAANLVPANNTYYNYSYAGNWNLYYDAVFTVTDSIIPSGVSGRSVFEYASGGKTSWVIFCIGHRSGDSNLTNYTVNGTVLTSTLQSASSITNVGKLMLNGNGASAFDTTSVAEFIHYNRSLSQAERQQVEGYLSRKWNIPLPVASGFSPTSIAGCSTWLDAADSSTTTSLASGIWIDKSARGGNTTSNAGGGAFSVSNIRGIPAVSFPAASTAALLIPNNASLTTSTGLSIFMVLNSTTNNGSTRFLTANSGSLQFYVTSGDNPTSWGLYTPAGSFGSPTVTVSNNVPFVYSATIKTDLVRQSSNGIQTDTISAASTLTITSLTIGNYSPANSVYAFTGSIGEIIIYSNVVTDAQRKQIEFYLTDKWKITSHPFKTIRPDVTAVFTPATLPRCQLWLDGADPAGSGVRPAANSTVSTWVDKSGNMGNGTAIGTPTFLVEGGINLNGSSCFSNTTFKMTFANRSMFFVMQETSRSTNNGIFVFIPSPQNSLHDYEASSGIVYDTASGFETFWRWTPGDTINRVGYVYQMGNSTLLPRAIYNDNMNTVVGSGFVNGSNAANKTALASATTCSGYAVGGRYIQPNITNRLNGVIYEIIAYDRGLTNSERQQVEGYLAWKWNLNRSLPTTHPFYKVSPGPALRSIVLNQDELYLWLDASDLSTLLQNPAFITPVTASGQNVGVWLDKSGKQRHYLAQLNTYPTYSTRSQVPEVEFDVNGKVLGSKFLGTYNPQVANSSVCRNLDFFIVTRPLTSTGDWRTLFRGYNSDHHIIIQQGSYALGAYYNNFGVFRQYGSLTLDGSRRVIIHLSISLNGFQSASITELGEAYDGNVVMSAATEYFNADNTVYYLGGYQGGSQPWGYVCEILVFKRNLANQEKIQVFNYLNSTWFTRVTLKNAIDYLPLATNATNLGTSGNAVTTMGNVVYNSSTGKAAAYFNDTYSLSQYLILPYTNPEKFTFCFWLYAIDGYYYTAISLTTAALNSYIMALQVDTGVNGYGNGLTVYTAMPNQWTNQPTGSFSVQQWTHYAVTINQITFVEQLYVNGVLADTRTGSGSSLSRTDRFVLGRSGDNSRGFWGYIRQFAVFNTILTPYEVRDIYLATV